MRVLLINPFRTREENKREYPMEPLGLLSLISYLNVSDEIIKRDIHIKILDAQIEGSEKCVKTKRGFRSGLSDEELTRELKEFGPNIVGISNNYTNNTQDVAEIINLTKDVLPKSFIVLGGAHATIGHKDMIDRYPVDAIVRSEGEITLKEIIIAINDKKKLDNILGLTFRKGKKIQINEDRPLIEDINVLPIPDRSFVNYKKYLARTSENYFFTKNSPVGTLFSARGCPFRCVFCSTQAVWRNKWRGRSAENIIKEIEYLKDNFGVREISFMDDQFMGSKQRIIELCRGLIKRKLGVSLICPAGISPSLIDIDTLRLMRDAGFYRICFSIDVGTPKARDFVKKPVKLDEMRDLIRKTNALGIWTYATFVIGFPDENESDLKQTIKFAYNLKLDFLRFYIVHPHLGSDIYRYYLENKMINKEMVERFHSLDEPLIGTKYISAKRLKILRDKAERGYLKHQIRNFLNPAYVFKEFLPKISSFDKLTYFIGLIKNYSKA